MARTANERVMAYVKRVAGLFKKKSPIISSPKLPPWNWRRSESA
jgi:hypothetical protein